MTSQKQSKQCNVKTSIKFNNSSMPEMTDFVMVQSIAEMITQSATDPQTVINIQEMHKHPKGAETLRLIVRDNIAGAGDVIANALLNKVSN